MLVWDVETATYSLTYKEWEKVRDIIRSLKEGSLRHDCESEDCEICKAMDLAETLLKTGKIP